MITRTILSERSTTGGDTEGVVSARGNLVALGLQELAVLGLAKRS
jgi:hypothetical protein